MIRTALASLKTRFGAFWRGELSLLDTFWIWGLAAATAVPVLTYVAVHGLLAPAHLLGLPSGLQDSLSMTGAAIVYLGFSHFAVPVALWRSAGHSKAHLGLRLMARLYAVGLLGFWPLVFAAGLMPIAVKAL